MTCALCILISIVMFLRGGGVHSNIDQYKCRLHIKHNTTSLPLKATCPSTPTYSCLVNPLPTETCLLGAILIPNVHVPVQLLLFRSSRLSLCSCPQFSLHSLQSVLSWGRCQLQLELSHSSITAIGKGGSTRIVRYNYMQCVD